jgi:hypothetical protein
MLASLADRYRDVPEHLRLERRVEMAGLGLLALLVLLLLLVLFSFLRSSSVERLPPSADSIAVADAFQEESVSSTQSLEIRARPLFWVSRRPDVAIPAEVVSASEDKATEKLKPLKFQVSGIFAAGTDEAGFIAVMKNQVRRVRLGELIDGWTVSRIGSTEVELSGAGTVRVIAMERRPVAAASDVTTVHDDGDDNAEQSNVDPGRLTLGGRRPPQPRPRRLSQQGHQG